MGAIEIAFLQAQSGQWRDMSLVLVHCWPSGTQLVVPRQVVDYLVLVWEDMRKSNMAQEATQHAE